jgi:hypothetical protein
MRWKNKGRLVEGGPDLSAWMQHPSGRRNVPAVPKSLTKRSGSGEGKVPAHGWRLASAERRGKMLCMSCFFYE